VQTPQLLVILNEDDALGFRQIYLDGRPHPKEVNPTWAGHATGRWEKDTLVVDVAGFNEQSWLDVYPHTTELHVTERYRRLDFGHMDVHLTVEDPGTLSKPWNVHMVWNLAPKEDILENVCTENNRDADHFPAK
jgi:hypothetical protein